MPKSGPSVTNAPALFINYRRADTQVFARDLHKHLAAGFGFERVFMDRAEIRAGEHWAQRLDQELARSTIFLALIGPDWLKLKDSDHRRRIDGENDWVRRELATALADGKEVIPIYVGGAEPIDDARKLPADLADLPARQRIVLMDESWSVGMGDLIRRLEELGLRAARPGFPLPTRLKKVAPLTPAELDAALADLPHWKLTGEERLVPHATGPIPHSELYREYPFSRFEDATAFMAQASSEINRFQHHPRWENFWTTVRVWLSTWDIEFKPSTYDVALAKRLDQAYRDFQLRSKDDGSRFKDDTKIHRLEAAEVERRVRQHPGWALMAGKLERTLRFEDFQSAFGFMASVAFAAEKMDHHPEWFNVYDTVRIQLTTHNVGGISENDFQLVQKIDALAIRHGVR